MGDISSSEGISLLKSFWSKFLVLSVWVSVSWRTLGKGSERFLRFKFVWEDVEVEDDRVCVDASAVDTFVLLDDDEDLSLDFQILVKVFTINIGDWNLKDSNLSDATSLANISISLDKLKITYSLESIHFNLIKVKCMTKVWWIK